jgi:hypothetical protein
MGRPRITRNVQRLGRFSSRVRPLVFPGHSVVPKRYNASGAAVDACRDQFAGVSTWRMAVWWPFRAPSLDRHVRRAFMRNAWLDFTPLVYPQLLATKEVTSRHTVDL